MDSASYGRRSFFTYKVAASAAGKSSRLQGIQHGVNVWTQQDLEREPSFFSSVKEFSGEDAFFMSHVARSDRHILLGIADGVGGWTESGIDPSQFSHGLCRYMAEATYRPEKEDDLMPKNLLQKAYDQVQNDRAVLAGGSTATVAAIESNGTMKVANLGDSGFVVLRPGKVAYKSEPQTHAFNTPYQLSKLTREMQAQRAIFGGSVAISEKPTAADDTSHALRQGDVVVFASDGLWDNLSSMDVLGVISSLMEKEGLWAAARQLGSETEEALVNGRHLQELPASKSGSPIDLAGRLAYAVLKEAKTASLDRKRDGPFAREVRRNFPREDYRGGKVDDITVVVCIAVESTAQHAPMKAKL